MLTKIKKNITLTASSVVDEVAAETYTATINSENPEDMNITSWKTNKELYKENRVQCRQDSADFEDAAYALQDEIIAAASAEANET